MIFNRRTGDDESISTQRGDCTPGCARPFHTRSRACPAVHPPGVFSFLGLRWVKGAYLSIDGRTVELVAAGALRDALEGPEAKRLTRAQTALEGAAAQERDKLAVYEGAMQRSAAAQGTFAEAPGDEGAKRRAIAAIEEADRARTQAEAATRGFI